MADDDAPEIAGAAGGGEDAGPRTPRTHDPVETVWLGTRRPPPPRVGRPRLSTVLLVLAFAALLTLYIMLR
ncbi:hypothetical protein AB0H71_25755 [Nocardia sp. NPDC050697]|uniref:hypothetical protein n=1 Tax=Nocardia sp. NPDC050697 TaxID=3155158 RepID=UPI00340B152A